METVTYMFFQSACWLLKLANEATSTYHQQTNDHVGRYNRTLTAVLQCIFIIIRGTEMRTHLYSHTPITATYIDADTSFFELLVDRRDFRLDIEIYSDHWKMLSPAEERTGFLATLQHLLNCARAFAKSVQKGDKIYFPTPLQGS